MHHIATVKKGDFFFFFFLHSGFLWQSKVNVIRFVFRQISRANQSEQKLDSKPPPPFLFSSPFSSILLSPTTGSAVRNSDLGGAEKGWGGEGGKEMILAPPFYFHYPISILPCDL